MPYPARVAFDDWGILYTNNELAVAKGNVVKHTIDIEFENAGSGSMSVPLVSADNKEIVTTSAQPPVQPGNAKPVGSTPASAKTAPKTGDEQRAGAVLLVSAFAGLAIACVAWRKRRNS